MRDSLRYDVHRHDAIAPSYAGLDREEDKKGEREIERKRDLSYF